ncbi:MAG: hypothetical protein M0R51_15280 [Clostridia bacterium]|jgi:hypothetical protein|nr:hypothetical protein [Clostridia bacterium]
MELKDTAELMTSIKYKERFKAEYYQLAIRTEKLESVIKNYDKNKFTCSKHLLKKQLRIMKQYLKLLVKRAHIEVVPIEEK